LLILLVVSVVAEREGYLVLGERGENPIAIVAMALLIKAVSMRMTIVIPPREAPFTRQLPRSGTDTSSQNG
jgi:hypothetical protein